MYIFQSMTHVTVYIVITVFILLFIAQRKNPLISAGLFVQEIFTSRKYLFHFAAMIGILFFNKLELSIEKLMKHHGDFTGSIYKFEGNFVVFFQQFFHHDILTFILTFFYVIVFPAIMITSIAFYTFQKNYTLFYSICYAMMINYMVAIPFYLFFPVNEVWSFHPDVQFLMLDVFPTFESEYRPLSGLDNCFPSLHTSLSVSMAVIALRSGNWFWSRFVAASAGIIIFSIFYLGIHWFTDMIGGLALGLSAAHVALRISEGRFVLGDVSLPQRIKEQARGGK